MTVSLTIVRYKKRFIPFAILSMAVFRIPLLFRSGISFWKLMGCGNNGTFDMNPDWQQWGLLSVHRKTAAGNPAFILSKNLYGRFINNWWSFFNCEVYTILLEPTQSHGYWNGKQPFGAPSKSNSREGAIAVLTRATIRIGRLKSFWKNVPAVAGKIAGADGFISSVGIGEWPFIRQATFSVWKSKECMQDFAYKMNEHADVIKKTKAENWYSEELFARFKIIAVKGTIKGQDPLAILNF
jgi:hypothetical protein